MNRTDEELLCCLTARDHACHIMSCGVAAFEARTDADFYFCKNQQVEALEKAADALGFDLVQKSGEA